MYKHTLRVNGEYLAKAQALPKNASSTGNGGTVAAGSMMGAVEVVMAAADAVTLPANATISLLLEDSDDGRTFGKMPVRSVVTMGGSDAQFAAGEEIARLPVASTARKKIRCVMTTDATGVSGSVDVFCDFLPR
ncbi:MAG: hypothetical protein MI749_10325 [Desulfovibrionales bacterium]|nr:hypothetical protein [Desulfovibrionales bacterium]